MCRAASEQSYGQDVTYRLHRGRGYLAVIAKKRADVVNDAIEL